MAAHTSPVPDVAETDLDRDDLEEAAAELGIENVDDLDDQALFERIGVALGEVDAEDVGAADQAEDAADDATDDAQNTADEATDQADDATDDAQDTADEATDQAEDTAENATDDADDDATDDAQVTADEATDQAEDTADDATDDAQDTADEATDQADDATDEPSGGSEQSDDDEPPCAPAKGEGEYRFEDDPREGIEPVLDLELGPVALDVLGVEVHLKRVHAALTANPNGGRNVIGKVLAALAKALDNDDEDGSGPEQNGDGSDGSEDDGLLHKITAPARGLARGVRNTFSSDD